MSEERRRTPRRPFSHPATVFQRDGKVICACLMQDVSDTGARLKISNPRGTAKIDLPDNFVLAISRSGNVFRRCKLIWRRNDEFGVHFTDLA